VFSNTRRASGMYRNTDHRISDSVVAMKNCIFWDITSCNPLKVNGRFGGKCGPHLQERKISEVRNQHEECSKITYLTYSSTLNMEVIYLSKRRLSYVPQDGTLNRSSFSMLVGVIAR
jgi:hypothetical protein